MGRVCPSDILLLLAVALKSTGVVVRCYLRDWVMVRGGSCGRCRSMGLRRASREDASSSSSSAITGGTYALLGNGHAGNPALARDVIGPNDLPRAFSGLDSCSCVLFSVCSGVCLVIVSVSSPS